MHTISGLFSSEEQANKASDALNDAGVSSSAISLDASDDGTEHVMSIILDGETAAAARAIFAQSGARNVEEVDNTATDPDAETPDNFRDPLAPLVAPVPR